MSATDCHKVHDESVNETLKKILDVLKEMKDLLKQIEKNTKP